MKPIIFNLLIMGLFGTTVNAATGVADVPNPYITGDDLELTFTIVVNTGTFTITYGENGNDETVGSVTVSDGSFTEDGEKPTHISVQSSTTEIKVTITLTTGDEGKFVQLVYDDDDAETTNDADENKDFQVKLSCPAITGIGGDNRNVKSSGPGSDCDATNYRYGGCVTTFDCVAGYYAAEVESTCTAGAWATALPDCTAITCTELTVTGGTITCTDGTTKYGTECTVTCNSGYSLTAGTETVTCADGSGTTGAWTGTTPHTCTETSCSIISNPDNGASTCSDSTSSPADTCSITCNSGYILSSGTSELTCSSAGEWSDTTTPECTETSCSIISNPDNGASTCSGSISSPADTCSITCNSGYILSSGTSELTCNSAGEWSDATMPVCSSAAGVKCAKIESPTNGNSNCSNEIASYDEICLISCDEGYTLQNGTATITCTETGAWNSTLEHVCSGVRGNTFGINTAFNLVSCLSLLFAVLF